MYSMRNSHFGSRQMSNSNKLGAGWGSQNASWGWLGLVGAPDKCQITTQMLGFRTSSQAFQLIFFLNQINPIFGQHGVCDSL